ncbi:hypothetical protein FJZ53_04895 [Candidatus Woesearchaeota archaeon]|nr:hypothetical protein [Candidatus Woesearchaeota archaeon]
MEIVIEKIKERKEVIELVERKGTGHPDTLCDSVCEEASKALSKYYLEHFGKVLHHNIDKGLLVAGISKIRFKDGIIKKPIEIIIAGRATSKVGDHIIPVRRIILKAAKDYLRQFSLAKFKVIVDVKPGAANLVEVFEKKVPVANDTSFGVSHFPHSELESLVLEVGDLIDSESFRKKYPCVGRDFKVMGFRNDKKTVVTIAIAFISRFVKDMQHYKELKDKIVSEMRQRFKVEAYLNTLDSYEDASSVYLTISGLSAEQGDDGQVGRGNRYNQLITPNRPMSLEALAGKNVNHPGKLYQIMAYRIAKDVYEKTKAKYVEVKMLTQIGKPLSEPQVVSLRIEGEATKAEQIVRENLKNIKKIQEEIIFS